MRSSTTTIAAPAADSLSDLEQQAWRGFMRAHACLVKRLDAELEAEHGLPLSSYEVLLRLDAAPRRRMRMRDLADAVSLSRSGLTRLVDRLAAGGLIERACCDSDARGQFAVLTEHGAATVRDAGPTHLAGVRRLFVEHFGEGELAQLVESLERLAPAGACDEAGNGRACA